MALTRQTAELLTYADSARAKVVAVGDPGQLGAVDAGGWLAALARTQQGAPLRTVMRQRDHEEQVALEALHDGDPAGYLKHKQDAIVIHETAVDAIPRLVDSWHAAQLQHGVKDAAMIARDNLTRERLNRAARRRLKEDMVLPADGVIVGGREYVLGDRVITRRNDRSGDVDNGSLGTIVALYEQAGSMIIETDSGKPKALGADYVSKHVEHAHALTAHGAQGGTVESAGVVGRPPDFTREWAYTSFSRARSHTAIHVISEPNERNREREEYAPPEPRWTPSQTRQALRQALARSETEPLALERVHADPAGISHPTTRTAVEPNGVDLLRRSTQTPRRRSLRP